MLPRRYAPLAVALAATFTPGPADCGSDSPSSSSVEEKAFARSVAILGGMVGVSYSVKDMDSCFERTFFATDAMPDKSTEKRTDSLPLNDTDYPGSTASRLFTNSFTARQLSRMPVGSHIGNSLTGRYVLGPEGEVQRMSILDMESVKTANVASGYIDYESAISVIYFAADKDSEIHSGILPDKKTRAASETIGIMEETTRIAVQTTTINLAKCFYQKTHPAP